jgi:hypothetical protein
MRRSTICLSEGAFKAAADEHEERKLCSVGRFCDVALSARDAVEIRAVRAPVPNHGSLWRRVSLAGERVE